MKVGIVATAIILLGAIGLTVTWRLGRNESVTTNSATDSSQSNNKGAASGANSNKQQADSPPPPGMAYVPGGTFIMGSHEGDQDSRPPHSVTVKPFFIDVYEVTCEEYKKFIDDAGHAAPGTWTNGNYPAGAGRHPVTGVSWDDADAYARWAGKRLPIEEEWEFAARGQGGLRYPWGNSWKPGCANADKEGQARNGMAEVGSHDCGSPSGAMDMIGNAWEWTASDWAPYPGGNLQYPTEGGEKVIRGGSWQSSQKYATSIYRSGLIRSGDKTGYDKTGFRCAKDTQR